MHDDGKPVFAMGDRVKIVDRAEQYYHSYVFDGSFGTICEVNYDIDEGFIYKLDFDNIAVHHFPDNRDAVKLAHGAYFLERCLDPLETSAEEISDEEFDSLF